MTDPQRAAFEAWCDSEGINPKRSDLTDVYDFPSARVAWRSWQAAQAADAGREDVQPVYQIAFSDEEGWCDTPKNYYDRHPAHMRRIVYLSIPIAINAELVEALEALMDHFDKASYDEAFTKARAALSRAKEQKS